MRHLKTANQRWRDSTAIQKKGGQVVEKRKDTKMKKGKKLLNFFGRKKFAEERPIIEAVSQKAPIIEREYHVEGVKIFTEEFL